MGNANLFGIRLQTFRGPDIEYVDRAETYLYPEIRSSETEMFPTYRIENP